MKKSLILLALLLTAALLAGCGGYHIDDRLPQEPAEFVMGDFVNPDDAEDEYGSVTYLDRVYIPFGTLKGSTLTNEDVGPCLGYLVRDDTAVEQILFFPLAEDENTDFLVCLDQRSSKDVPVFFRAVDTVEKELAIPSCIRPSDDKFWN